MQQLEQAHPPKTPASPSVQTNYFPNMGNVPNRNASTGITLKVDNQSLIDMNTLEREIPIKVRSLFTSGFTPLTSEKVPNPAPRDLSNFWDQVKKNIRSLGSDIEIEKLKDAHIKVLMPYTIGVSYLRFTDRSYDTWEEF